MTRRAHNARGGPLRSPRQIRADWVAAVARGRSATVTMAGATMVAASEMLAAVTADIRHLQPDNFPIEAWSAREMARAFFALARVFCSRDINAETRTACAPALVACAEALDRLLTDLRNNEAQGWRSRTGERD